MPRHTMVDSLARRRVASAVMLCLAGALLACSDSGPPVLFSIELTPNRPTVQVGQSLQLTAMGRFTDETRVDFTQSARWTSSDLGIATVSRGLVTAVEPGVVTIMAIDASGVVGDVEVTVPVPAPVLTAVEPNAGPISGGTEIRLMGKYFTPEVTVTIGGAQVGNLRRFNANTLITCVTPPGAAGARDVVVTTAQGSTTLAGGFRYYGAPTVSRVRPATGPAYGGTLLTIEGGSFTPDTKVTLGGAPLTGITFINDTTLVATTPPGRSGDAELVVTNELGSIKSSELFSYYDTWLPSNAGMDGGYVRVMVRHPSDPSILYAGTYEGGVFRSTNAGQTWTAINKELTYLSVHALVIDPTSPSTLYAGTHGGLFKTTNGGASWFQPGSTPGFVSFTAMVIDPANPSTLYGSVSNAGVIKSTDAGASWSAVNTGLGSLSIQALAIDPINPQILYAGTNTGVIMKTTNGGQSWSPARTGVPDAAFFIRAIAINPKVPDTVYAATSDGIYKTTNGGASWVAASTGLGSKLVEDLAILEDTPDTLYAGTQTGLFKTTTGGTSWSNVSTGLPSAPVFTLLADRSNPGTLYAGAGYSGVFKTTDGAASWSATRTGMNNMHVVSVEFSPVLPDVAYAGTTDGVFKTADAGESWSEVSQGLSHRQVQRLAVHPTDAAIVYAGTYRGLDKTVNGGATWSNVFAPTRIISAVAIHPTSPETVYVGGTNGLSRTTNGGATWTSLTQGLPASGWFRAIAISRQTPSTLYAATPDKVYRSTDGGDQWVEVSTGLPAESSIDELHVIPGTPETVYVASFNAGLHKSVDGGTSWERILEHYNGLSLLIDPADPRTLYVGTTRSILRSRDGGQNWMELGGPFYAYIEALAMKPGAPRTILAGSGGRGIYKTTTGGD